MSRVAGFVGAIGASLIVAAALWFTDLPLGIPGEWTWPRLPADAASGWNLLLAAIAAGAYLAFVAMGQRRLSRPLAGSIEVGGWNVGLVAAAFAWLWIVQDTAPSAGQLAKAPFILYYPSSSGYFTKARYESPDPQAFLRDYETLMQQGDVLHVGTHPPGLFLVYHGLIALGQQWPGMLATAWTWAPESVREATAVVQENTRSGRQPLTDADAQVLWLTGLLVLGLSAATVAPLYGLLRLALSRDVAFLGAALWPAVPAVAMFWPKSDAAFPFVSTLLVWCAFTGWTTGSRLRAAAAGLVLFAGLFCSLAFLPVALFVTLVISHEAIADLRANPRTVRRTILWSACGFAGFFIPIFASGFCGLRLDRIWLWNYRNHAGFYAQYQRTYWQWLLVNPVELAIAVGAPVAVAAVLGGRRTWSASVPAIARHAAVWGFSVWGLLWLTGKNSGEAARLWLLFLPGLVAVAAAGLRPDDEIPAESRRIPPIFWLALQLAMMILTVHRIGGFHFENL